MTISTISSPRLTQSLPIRNAALPGRLTFAALLLLLATSAATILAQANPKPAAKPAPKPEPDVVLFTNGDQLTGAVERGAGDGIVFKSDMAGEITIPFAKIKELRAHGAFAMLRKDTKTPTTNVQEGALTYYDGRVSLINASGGTETVAPKDIDFLIDKPTYDKQVAAHPGLLKGWEGTITGGATIVRSTQNGSTFTAETTLIRAIPTVSYLPAKDRSIFNLNETYGKLTQPVIPQTVPPTPTSIAKTDIFHAGFEQDRYFSPRFYILADTTFDHDFSQGLRLQQVYGAGAGVTIIKRPKQQLDFKADVHYEKQNFQQEPAPAVNSPDENLIGSTLSELYHRNLPHGIVFTENADALPAFNNVNAFSADINAALTLPVFKRFGLSLGTTDNFLNDPAIGYKKNSFQFVTGVTYTLP
jgi:hypothetical protein